jgi:hypothetical protein
MKFIPVLLTLVAFLFPACQTSAPSTPEFFTEPMPTATIPAELPHPYLFVRKSDLARIKETIAALPEAKTQYDKLVKDTDPSRAVALPEIDKPTQPDWSTRVGREGSHAARCGFLFQMTGEQRYANWAKSMLLMWAEHFDTHVDFRKCSDFNMIEPGHVGNAGNNMGFYHGGILLQNTAMAYDCIYDALTADERATIENGFFRKFVAAMESVDYSARIPNFAPDFLVNGGQWNGANLCNMGLTAVGFVLKDAHLYNRGIKNFKLQLGRDMLADGFWVEEDRNYADTCMASMFNIAWMAKSAGYPEDLFTTWVEAKGNYDPKYAVKLISERRTRPGMAHGLVMFEPTYRSLSMYLDAHVDYQYPDLGPGNWGWYANKGAVADSSNLQGMYTVGYGVYGKPAYAFILQKANRSQAGLGAGISSLLYFGKKLENISPPNTKSMVYPHGRWVALKSIEGPAYWNSDSMYAFMPYGTERSKPLQPLTLDIFAFGKVLAPRVGIKHQAQSLTTDYQLTEPAWNGVLTDGRNHSLLKERPTHAWMAWQDLGSLVKIVAPQIHWVGGRQSELYQESIEPHPEESRTTSRILAMTDTYLVDVYTVRYDLTPKYHHNFDYVLHGYGKLTIETPRADRNRMVDTTVTWMQEGGIGLRSTILAAAGAGTKLKTYVTPAMEQGPATEMLIASRAGRELTFGVVHEPVKGESKLAGITKLGESTDYLAVQVTHKSGVVDVIAVRLNDGAEGVEIGLGGGKKEVMRGCYLFIRRDRDGVEERQEKGSFER